MSVVVAKKERENSHTVDSLSNYNNTLDEIA